mgnify:CR=1 FL=1
MMMRCLKWRSLRLRHDEYGWVDQKRRYQCGHGMEELHCWRFWMGRIDTVTMLFVRL